MVTFRFPVFPAVCLAALGFNSAVAGSLEIVWIRTAGTTLPGNDSLVVDGGGTDPGPLLTSGLDVAATDYLATTMVPPSGPTYSSSFESLAGATVAYGYMSGVVAATLRTNYGHQEFSRAFLRASWTDMVTMIPVDPALIGTAGTSSGSVLVDLTIDGTVSGFDPASQSGGDNQSSFSFGVVGSAATSGSYGFGCEVMPNGDAACSDGLSPPTQPPAHQTVSVPYTLSFTWGTPFDLGVEVGADSISTAGPSASSDPDTLSFLADGSVNFLSTVLWQGIAEARDADGTPVAFSVTSDSGTDWAQPATPVPAPGALLLFLTSFGGIALRGGFVRLPRRRTPAPL